MASQNPQNQNGGGPLNQLVDQLVERYSGDWERTPSRLFGDNFRALRTLCHSSRLGSVTNIVICGLGSGGTLEEQQRNASLDLNDAYLEYTQKIFFTQLSVARLMRDLIQERHRLQLQIYACDPAFTPHDVAVLGCQNVTVIPANRQGPTWHDRGTLIYDVTQDQQFFYNHVNLTWQGPQVPPAAIITCVSAVMRNRVGRQGGEQPFEVEPAYLRKYYLLPLMDLGRRTGPSSAERHAVEQIQDSEQRAEARAAMRERESMSTQAGYEYMINIHNDVMGEFHARLVQQVRERRQYYQSVRDEEGYRTAEVEVNQEMTPLVPRDTNSYIYDPMMVLLYRKPAPTL